jgi:hypothetical protein
MKFFLLVLSSLLTQTALAQVQDKLYYGYTRLIHQWDIFVLIKGDTAFAHGLSEIKGMPQEWTTDTMYRKNDSVYIGQAWMILSDNKQLFFVNKKKSKNRTELSLINDNKELTHAWNRRNNLLVCYEINDKIDDKYYAMRRQVSKKSKPPAELEEVYRQLKWLEMKADSLGQEDFRVQAKEFEKQCLAR